MLHFIFGQFLFSGINISSDEDLALDLQMPKRNNKDSKEVDNNLVQNNKNGQKKYKLNNKLLNSAFDQICLYS